MDLLPLNASPLKFYRQAKRLLRSTSRAKEADWYREASELDLQWHLWIGPHSGHSAIYSRSQKQWWTGPTLPPIAFETDEIGKVIGLNASSREALHELLEKILTAKEFGEKPKSLGVVIHLANGLRIRELAPEFAADPNFDSVNELLISAPEIALGDDTVDNADGTWRILPLLGITEGARRAIAVQVSSKLGEVVKTIRSYGTTRNFPIIVSTRSAPLEAISGVAYLYPELLSVGKGATLTLIQYELMTLLFAIGDRGELLLARPLLHRNAPSLTPLEIHEALAQSAALLNIKAPNILFVSVTGMGEEHLRELLEPYCKHAPDAAIHCINTQTSPLVEGVPGARFEFAISVLDEPPTPDEADFQKELRQRWCQQDFFGLSSHEQASMPTRGDLQLLILSSVLQKVAALGILAFCGWTGMDFISKMRSEAWRLPPDATEMMEMQHAKLQKERSEWQHWDGLLQKRSEGWLALETLLEIFPSDGGMILKEADYSIKSDNVTKDSEAIGLTRSWRISGYANPTVASALPTLGSRNRIAEILNTIAEENLSPYLAVGSPTREIQVSLQQRQGAMSPTPEFPPQVARQFNSSFELYITQSLTNKDELAIRIAK